MIILFKYAQLYSFSQSKLNTHGLSKKVLEQKESDHKKVSEVSFPDDADVGVVPEELDSLNDDSGAKRRSSQVSTEPVTSASVVTAEPDNPVWKLCFDQALIPEKD